MTLIPYSSSTCVSSFNVNVFVVVGFLAASAPAAVGSLLVNDVSAVDDWVFPTAAAAIGVVLVVVVVVVVATAVVVVLVVAAVVAPVARLFDFSRSL